MVTRTEEFAMKIWPNLFSSLHCKLLRILEFFGNTRRWEVTSRYEPESL